MAVCSSVQQIEVPNHSCRPQTLLHTPSSQPGYTSDQQLNTLSASFRTQNKKIGVFWSQPNDRPTADSITRRLDDLLSGGIAQVQQFQITQQNSRWLKTAQDAGVDHYIFVGLVDFSGEDYFNPNSNAQRIGEVVVVCCTNSAPRRRRDYVHNFLRLESNVPEQLAERALGLFAGCRPVPFEADKVHWSINPKLVILRNVNNLGFTVATRKMSPRSQFPTIVHITSFTEDCFPDIKKRLAKNTHIQSCNGVVLDGMNIDGVKKVLSKFKQSTTEMQLIVRHCHNIKNGNGTPATPGHHVLSPTATTPQDSPDVGANGVRGHGHIVTSVNDKLTIKDLKKVRTAAWDAHGKWYDIGIELEIDVHKLNAIQTAKHHQPGDCFTDVLQEWILRVEPPPTWSSLLEALRSPPVRFSYLAEQVKQKYCTPMNK